jgi:hypothetical protein
MLQKIEDNDSGTVINYTSIEKAIVLVEYFRLNADKVKDIIENGVNPLDDLPLIYRKLYHDLNDEFTVKDEIEKFTFHGVTGTSIYNFLKKKKLFIDVKHGIWKKKL